MERWLQPGTRYVGEVVDHIILEQFLTNLGGNTQHWVRRHQSKTMEEALHLAEDYVTAKVEGEAPKKEWPGGTGMGQRLKGPSSMGRRGEGPRLPSQESRAWDARDIICYRCGEKGHVLGVCQHRPQMETTTESPHEEKNGLQLWAAQGPRATE